MAYDVAFYLPSLGPLLAPEEGIPSAGGAETQIWLLARGLAQRARNVCVVVTDTPGGLPPRIDGVDVAVRPPLRTSGGTIGKARELRALWGTLAPLESRAVVQRTAGVSTGLVGAVTRANRRRFVYSSANIVDFEFESLASTPMELRLFNLGIRLADRIVVQTHEQAERCLTKFGREAVVVKSVAEPAGKRAGAPDWFLWVGRLVDYKHPEAFLELARALPEARFRMVGLPASDQPDLLGAIESGAKEIPNLELMPPRSRPELLRLYDTAAAVVNTAECEGMPNIFLEGWARGIPALTLTHDPDGVIAGAGLGGFAGGSMEKLVELARAMWSSRQEQATVSKRCREYVRREHSLDSAVSGWIEALGLDGSVQEVRRRARGARAGVTPAVGNGRNGATRQLRVLVLTNMWPTAEHPAYGSFVASQTDSVARLGVSVRVHFVNGRATQLAYLRTAARILRLNWDPEGFDLIHAHSGHAGALALFQRRIPVLTSLVGYDVLGEPGLEWRVPLKSRIESTLFRQLARLFDRTITKSRQMERALPRSVRSRNSVLPNGVDRELFRPYRRDLARRQLGWGQDEQIVLFVGDVDCERKRHDLASEAIELARNEFPRVRLEVCSKIPQHEVPLWMNGADLLILASNVEGSPNAVKEAMACDLPIVGVDAGDVREIVEGTRNCYVVKQDPAALADGVRMVLSSDLRSDGRARTAHLALRAIADRLLAMYLETVGAPTRALSGGSSLANANGSTDHRPRAPETAALRQATAD